MKRFASLIIIGSLSACSSGHHLADPTSERSPAQVSNVFKKQSIDIRYHDLASLQLGTTPWLNIEANSEQRQPVYLGNVPREIEFNQPKESSAVLPTIMKLRAKKLAQLILKKHGFKKLEVEAWPARNDDGVLTWTFSRWRESSSAPWIWFENSDYKQSLDKMDPMPFLPQTKDLSNSKQFGEVFNDFLTMGIYDKPLIGDCIWTTPDGEKSFAAWIPTIQREIQREAFNKNESEKKEVVCRVLPMPSRLNGDPKTYQLTLTSTGIGWPADLKFADQKESEVIAEVPTGNAVIKNWPSDFADAYKNDLKMISEPGEVVFPISGKRVAFTRKNSAQKDNQLLELADYLTERYQELGVSAHRQEFMWRGIKQANLIAVIPGSLQGKNNKPVLMADHFDTAFAGEVYDATHKRISVPGADDNHSATVALLQAARILKESKPLNDIWLVHLTGEEYPGDDLGARKITEQLLKDKQEITGLVLMDMIAYRTTGDKIFQINPGNSDESLRIAAIAKQVSSSQAPRLDSVIRTRFDHKSYLYNTDGLIFSDAGFPVVLFNEHINHYENIDRNCYHEMCDTVAKIDWDYTIQIVKTAIETAARLAGAHPVN